MLTHLLPPTAAAPSQAGVVHLSLHCSKNLTALAQLGGAGSRDPYLQATQKTVGRVVSCSCRLVQIDAFTPYAALASTVSHCYCVGSDCRYCRYCCATAWLQADLLAGIHRCNPPWLRSTPLRPRKASGTAPADRCWACTLCTLPPCLLWAAAARRQLSPLRWWPATLRAPGRPVP